MNAGQGSIASSSRNRPNATPGPPFALTSADNGLSVDPITGRIVLGNDIGGTAAKLLSAREIDFNANSFQFIDTAGFGLPGTTIFSDGYFQLTKDFPNLNGFFGSAGDANGDFQVNSDISLPLATPPRYALNNGIAADLIYLQNPSTGFEIADAAINRFLRLDRNLGLFIIGDIDALGNGATVTVDDTANTLLIDNTASTMGISINGVAGFTGTVTPVTTITVNNGIVTNVA